MKKSTNSKSMLIISYYYPPFWSTGTIRVAKMAKYLSRLGWSVTIITPRRLYMDPPDQTAEDYDRYATVKRIPLALPDVYVAFLRWAARWSAAIKPTKKSSPSRPLKPFRKHTFEVVYRPGLRKRLERLLFPIDFYVLWLPWACVYSTVYLWRHPEIRNVWITSPPFSQLLAGVWLKLLFRRLHFVADFQDHWIEDMNHRYPTPLHRRFETWAERLILRKADRLVFISEIHMRRCLEKGPWKEKASVIYNGFDSEDFSPPADPPIFSQLTLDYYGHIGEGRNIGVLIDTIAALVKEGEINRHQFVCRIYGILPRYFLDLIASHSLQDVIQQKAPLPYKEALAAMYHSFALLLSIDQDPYTSCYPSKYFEYLNVRRPIFVLGPCRGAGRHAMDNGIAVCADEDDAQGIRQALLSLWARFRSAESTVPYVDPEPFNRARLAQQLADLIEPKEDPDAAAV